jgi:hypothetical protein
LHKGAQQPGNDWASAGNIFDENNLEENFMTLLHFNFLKQEQI